MTHHHLDPSSMGDGGLGVRSVDVLLAGQAATGAFVASPNFPTYSYSWLRDGSFCARALDVVGEHTRAGDFHRWVERTIVGQRDRVDAVVAKLDAGVTPDHEEMLPTRYTLDGALEPHDPADPWPNYQLDGYGTWLWELREHLRCSDNEEFDKEAVELAARYLVAAWRTDCCDCWEEFGDGQHASTLAAIAAGLQAAGALLDEPRYLSEAVMVRSYLLETFARGGFFRKGATDDRVDASLLWLVLPFGVVAADDPLMQRTVAEVRAQLAGPGGGLYRYLGDTYYGGGQWLLLTSWLAWYDAIVGRRVDFEAECRWVVGQATAHLELPEQILTEVQDPQMVEPWQRRWGPVATPLLWSHAMYLIMSEAATSWK